MVAEILTCVFVSSIQVMKYVYTEIHISKENGIDSSRRMLMSDYEVTLVNDNSES
jgi:hypothetical protein